jgi:hypothetical protein
MGPGRVTLSDSGWESVGDEPRDAQGACVAEVDKSNAASAPLPHDTPIEALV